MLKQEKKVRRGGGEKVVLTKLLHLARKKKIDDELNIFSIRETTVPFIKDH